MPPVDGAIVSVVVGSEQEIASIGHGHVSVSVTGLFGQRRPTDRDMRRVIYAFDLHSWREVTVAEAEATDLRVRHLYED